MVPRQVDSTGRVPDGEEKSGPRKSTCNVNQKNSCKICEDKTIVTYEVMQDFCIKSMGIRAFSKNRNPHIAVLHAFPVVCLALTEKRATLHLCNDEFLDEKRNGNRNSEFGILISLQKFLFQTQKNAPTPMFFLIRVFTRKSSGKKTKNQTHFAELGFQLHLPGGLAPLVTGLCFLLAIPFAPVVSAVPPLASGPILCLLGALMCSSVRGIDWDDYQEPKKTQF